MARKLLALFLSIIFSIVAAAASSGAADYKSFVRAARSSSDHSTEESIIELPENPERYITLPGSREEITRSSSDEDEEDDIELMLRKPERTCDKYPPVCRKKSSPGPDCCKKICTNIKKDPLNCGRCGRKCKHNEICCKGHPVNVSSDPKNCGSCGKKCKKWETCVYGMCSYA